MYQDYHGYLLRYTESVWSNENPNAALAFFAPDAVIHGITGDVAMTPQDMVTWVGAITMLIETPSFQVTHIVAQDDCVAYVVRCQAISRRTGQTVCLTGQMMLRLDGDLIAEAFNHFDLIGFFAQLGLLPANLLESVLAGSIAA